MNTQLGSLNVAPATVSGKRGGCSGCWLALSAGCSSSASVNLTTPPRLTALLHLHFPAVLDCISVIVWVMLCECGLLTTAVWAAACGGWACYGRGGLSGRHPLHQQQLTFLYVSASQPADDMVIAPFFQRRGRPISQLVRIGIGESGSGGVEVEIACY